MPKSKKLQKQIESKLKRLEELLNKIDGVRAVNADNPKTWDPDTLYNLVENLKTTLTFLEDQRIKGKFDEFGQPLYQEGLCSLVDEYHEEDGEESEDY